MNVHNNLVSVSLANLSNLNQSYLLWVRPGAYPKWSRWKTPHSDRLRPYSYLSGKACQGHFQFANKARASQVLHSRVDSYLSCKLQTRLEMITTLAYCRHLQITAVKSFITSCLRSCLFIWRRKSRGRSHLRQHRRGRRLRRSKVQKRRMTRRLRRRRTHFATLETSRPVTNWRDSQFS
jgi:hypothetical protein